MVQQWEHQNAYDSCADVNTAGMLTVLMRSRRIGPFEEMLRVAAHLFALPDVDFTMSFGDNQCCDRRALAVITTP